MLRYSNVFRLEILDFDKPLAFHLCQLAYGFNASVS